MSGHVIVSKMVPGQNRIETLGVTRNEQVLPAAASAGTIVCRIVQYRIPLSSANQRFTFGPKMMLIAFKDCVEISMQNSGLEAVQQAAVAHI